MQPRSPTLRALDKRTAAHLKQGAQLKHDSLQTCASGGCLGARLRNSVCARHATCNMHHNIRRSAYPTNAGKSLHTRSVRLAASTLLNTRRHACVLREQRACYLCSFAQIRAIACTHISDLLARRINGQCGVQLLRRAHSASDCAQPVVVGGRAALAAPDYAAFSHRRLGRCSAAKAKAALGAESCADGRACGGQCDRSHGAIPMRPCVVCHARTVDRSV